MLMATVVAPDCFLASHFADSAYHLNLETLLRAIDANGLILSDAEDRLYELLCDQVSLLASVGKGKTAHALFEELLKKQRQKMLRFVKSECSCRSASVNDAVVTVSSRCKVDSLISDPAGHASLTSSSDTSVPVQNVAEYIGSSVEVRRRSWFESLPSLDKMATGEFADLLSRATRFSRWLRFYDKQIGKGVRFSGFQRGIEWILDTWITSSHFGRSQLSAEIITVIDESADRKIEPSAAFHRVRDDFVEPLRRTFNIPIKLSFKRDKGSICHARHLQTQSTAYLFERGFDIFEADGTFRRTFVKPDPAAASHLTEYRQLPEYVPNVSP